MKRSLILLLILALVVPVLFLGCEGDDGAQGPAGAPGVSTGTISGTVTNSATATGLSGATVATSPAEGTATTAADGTYTLNNVTAGVYTLTFKKTGFGDVTVSNVSVVAGGAVTKNVTLIPTAKVLVEPKVTGTAAPGNTLTASVTVTPLDGSTVTAYKWEQTNSVTVTIADNTASTTGVTLPGLDAFRDELFKVLAEPPGQGKLPPGVPLPPVDEEEFTGGIQDRFGVTAINPLALEEAGLVTLKVTVTTSNPQGTYSATVPIHAALPWKVNTGIQTVPTNVPVLLHGGTRRGLQTTWNWTLTPPVGSGVTLDNATIQNPSFTPTATGSYTVTETGSSTTFTVFAGTWAGAIQGLDANGRPTSVGCAPACHQVSGPNSIVTEIFGEWKMTGHAEIFTNNINAGGHYGESCFVCHTVGYDKDASNSGIDDQTNFPALITKYFDNTVGFSAGGSPIANAGNFADVLASFPDVARYTNIQCENCHGPSNPIGLVHANGILMDKERVSLSSDLCGSCHGEPARHGRYQQWQLSEHANYELAMDEHTSGNCSRCHTGNGFIVWGEKYDFDGATQLAGADITWDNNTVHPQTCQACHDPHDVGTITGEVATGGNAKVRIMGDTKLLVAGFQAIGVGRGAICMTCHNTRRGLRNDNYALVNTVSDQAPHAGAQADMLMGQNAYFVTVGIPSRHAVITDTCVRCHMETTPPPELLSYSLGGTNHTFFASPTICSECHDSVVASGVQNQATLQMNILKMKLETAIADQISARLANLDTVVLNPGPDNVTLTIADSVTVSDFTDSHGNMAVTITVNGTATTVAIDDIQINGVAFTAASLGTKSQVIVKSGWNYTQALNDRSKGVHNPSFILGMLIAAQNQMDLTDFTTI